MRTPGTFFLALFAVGCATGRAAVGAGALCEAGDSAMERSVLYFGRNIPGGDSVRALDWRRFVDSVVTPRFPQGLTVTEAVGQWRSAAGVVESERSLVLTIHHEPEARPRRLIDEIASEYRRRFRQEAVMRERTTTCVRFTGA